MSSRPPPSMSFAENAVNAASAGMGHYKGLMLCNRPFAGTQANHKLAGIAKTEKTTFTCGVVPESIGVNVPISAKEKQIKRPKKDSVLVKHKKWLSDLQKTKDQLEATYLAELQAKEEAQAKFQEHERKMREQARLLLRNGDVAEPKDSKEQSPVSGDKPVDKIQEKAQEKGAKHAAAPPALPAWAMTESKAEDAAEAKIAAEEAELLEFASSLSFDKYMGDLEVRMMMERLQRRISALEQDMAAESARDEEATERAARREMLEMMGHAKNAIMEAGDQPLSEENEALVAARALLEEDENMQNVHSTKSVVALVKAAKDKIGMVHASIHSKTIPPIEATVSFEPKVVVHEPNEGARLEGKNAVSNLPYMHRNPAI